MKIKGFLESPPSVEAVKRGSGPYIEHGLDESGRRYCRQWFVGVRNVGSDANDGIRDAARQCDSGVYAGEWTLIDESAPSAAELCRRADREERGRDRVMHATFSSRHDFEKK